jgi:hypothetical protein
LEHVNGHAFEVVIEDVDEGEDPETEEAVEDFISDAEFVIGDKEDELREINEELLDADEGEIYPEEDQEDRPTGEEDNGV